MAVQAGSQALLVKIMGNETNASAKNEETIEDTHLQVILSLLGGEGATVSEKVDEAHSNAAIHVQDEIVLLRGGDSLNSDCVVQ